MFKHGKKNEEPEHIEPDQTINAVENISASAVDEEVVVIEEINENDNANTTFNNPSQLEDESDEELIKCDKCDYRTGQNIYLLNHKEEIHNWCVFCFTTFTTQEKLKNHTETKHNGL